MGEGVGEAGCDPKARSGCDPKCTRGAIPNALGAIPGRILAPSRSDEKRRCYPSCCNGSKIDAHDDKLHLVNGAAGMRFM